MTGMQRKLQVIVVEYVIDALIMTLIYYFIKWITEPKVSHRKHTKRKRPQPKRYYIRGIKGKDSRIATKWIPWYHRTLTRHVTTPVEADLEVQPNPVPFESDSFIVGIDSRATRTLSNDKRNFIEEIKPVVWQHIKGIDGQLEIRGIDTI